MTRAEDRKQTLVDFCMWAEDVLPIQIRNTLVLQEANPVGLENPVLTFVVPRAMSHMVEHSCLRVVEAWDLLNDELIYQKMRALGTKNTDYEHLKRIRNKLIAHRVPNELGGRKHHAWYTKRYGDFESVLALIHRVAEKLAERVHRLQNSGRLPPLRTVMRIPQEFSVEDVNKMLDALRQHDLY